MRKNLEREVAASALGGGQGTEPILALITRGLTVFRGVRLGLRDAGLRAGIGLLQDGKTGRNYVRIALLRGVTARVHLASESPGTGMEPLVTVLPAQGRPRPYFDVPPAAAALAHRVGTNVEAATRILLGLERARRRGYELAEEATRWI
jgi:hypothetical protein